VFNALAFGVTSADVHPLATVDIQTIPIFQCSNDAYTDCAQFCLATSGCVAWVFASDSFSSYLKNCGRISPVFAQVVSRPTLACDQDKLTAQCKHSMTATSGSNNDKFLLLRLFRCVVCACARFAVIGSDVRALAQ